MGQLSCSCYYPFLGIAYCMLPITYRVAQDVDRTSVELSLASVQEVTDTEVSSIALGLAKSMNGQEGIKSKGNIVDIEYPI